MPNLDGSTGTTVVNGGQLYEYIQSVYDQCTNNPELRFIEIPKLEEVKVNSLYSNGIIPILYFTVLYMIYDL